jgi:HSP20 family protein
MTFVSVKPQHMRNRCTTWMDSPFIHDSATWEPRAATHSPVLVNTLETPTSYVIEVAAPGFDKSQFKIHVAQLSLTLSAQKEETAAQSSDTYTRREHDYRQFSRSFHLPKHVDTTAITAVYQDGILLVTVPKVAETPAKPTIEIKVS